MKNFQELQDKIIKWKKDKGATQEGTIDHLIEESTDLKKDPNNPLSLADVWILLLSACSDAGFSVDEMYEAVNAKLAINESRLWEVGEDGIIRHIKESKV